MPEGPSLLSSTDAGIKRAGALAPGGVERRPIHTHQVYRLYIWDTFETRIRAAAKLPTLKFKYEP